QTLSNYSIELLHGVTNSPSSERAEATSAMSKRYHSCIPIPEEQMGSLLESAVTKVEPYYDVVKIDKQTSSMMRKLFQVDPDPNRTPEISGKETSGPSKNIVTPSASHKITLSQNVAAEPQMEIVANGLREINDIMKDRCNPSDVFYMILETMYRGFSLNRVIFCLRDAAKGMMVAHFGLGEKVDELIPHFRFPMRLSSDIFNIVIAQGKGILIDDAMAPNIRKNLPEWYQDIITAPSFIVYPIVTSEGCIGMLYADKNTRGTMLTEVQKSSMEELRDKAIQAMSKKKPIGKN
ncbi:MAG: hypothetical protein L7F78_11570, partial [Syntrophales bacterium LBB04]|nr:hypothetical protein [Syntrophales bacterium LBB04]